MTRESRELQALSPDDVLSAHVRLEVGEVCRVEVLLPDLRISGDGPDLFEALVSVRRQLEPWRITLVCNGARRDVYPSPMLRQSASGRRAYVLTLPRTSARPKTVDIFDEAPVGSVLVTVDEQRAAFDEWARAEPGTGGASS